MRAWGDVGKSVRFKAGASARGGLRGRRAPERGSEIVQSVVAVPLVLLVVFATVQAGGMMLSVNRLTADLARACRQMDTAGLAFAVDRERNVRSEALGAVQGARLAPGATSRAAGEEGAGAGAGIVQRTDAVRVSFDVRYELPSLMAVPGLAHRTIARHVECEQLAGRIVEVEVGA